MTLRLNQLVVSGGPDRQLSPAAASTVPPPTLDSPAG